MEKKHVRGYCIFPNSQKGIISINTNKLLSHGFNVSSFEQILINAKTIIGAPGILFGGDTLIDKNDLLDVMYNGKVKDIDFNSEQDLVLLSNVPIHSVSSSEDDRLSCNIIDKTISYLGIETRCFSSGFLKNLSSELSQRFSSNIGYRFYYDNNVVFEIFANGDPEGNKEQITRIREYVMEHLYIISEVYIPEMKPIK